MKNTRIILAVAAVFLILSAGMAQTRKSSPVSDKISVGFASKHDEAVSKADAISALRVSPARLEQTAQTEEITQFKKGVSARRISAGNRHFASQPKSAENAVVTLEIIRPYWRDDDTACGYQILFDKDAAAYGELYDKIDEADGEVVAEDYDLFEYTLPTGATSDYTDREASVYLGDEIVSVEVPAGTYDILFTNPDPYWEKVYRIDWLESYPLRAGWQYNFTITRYNILVTEVPAFDLALEGVMSHDYSNTRLTSAEEVTVGIQNMGQDAVSAFKLTYSFDNGTEYTENVTLSEELAAGESATYTLKNKADFSAKTQHYIYIKAEAEGDERAENNVFCDTIWNVDPIELPFYYDWANPDDFYTDWIIDNADGNDFTWDTYNYSADDKNNYCARMRTALGVKGGPESITLFKPISMEAGKHHISFYLRTNGSETFEVLYGTRANPSHMTALKRYEEVTEEGAFARYTVNFEVAEAGSYYFAFNAYRSSHPTIIFIDNVSIDKGEILGNPDLQFNAIAYPLSSCSLGTDEDLIINVSNVGEGNIKRIKVKGNIGNLAVEKVIDTFLEAKKAEIDINVGQFDFSAVGEYAMNLSVEVIPDEDNDFFADTVASNNAATRTITHWEPVSLPFITTFLYNDTAMNNWATTVNSWNIDYQYLTTGNKEGVLYSRCFNLTAGKEYRFNMTYAVGLISGLFLFTDDILVLYGPSGTDIANWDTIMNVEGGYTLDNIVSEDYLMKPETTGAYSLAVLCPTNNGTVFILEMSVTEILDYDIRVQSVGPMPLMTPPTRPITPTPYLLP